MNYRIKTMPCVSDLLRRFTHESSGATAIEYALIAGGIGIVIVTSVSGVGDELVTIFTSVQGIF